MSDNRSIPLAARSRCVWAVAGLALVLPAIGQQHPGSAADRAATRPAGADVDLTRAGLDEILLLFGAPAEYAWEDKTFSRSELPAQFCVVYPGSFSVFMSRNRVVEFRHQGPGYLFGKQIQVGASLDDVLKELGDPQKVVQGEKVAYEDGVLYRDIDGRKGYCYYLRKDKGIRLFFGDDRVSALYIYPASYSLERHQRFLSAPQGKAAPRRGGRREGDRRDVNGLPFTISASGIGLSAADFSKYRRLPAAYSFNPFTEWPDAERMPPGCDPRRMLEQAKNPGLGVRGLHREGFTGKGVSVAIIDQPLLPTHPEYKGKLAAYHDVGCQSEVSMHGPAVASLLVGTNCGTAPDASLYYVAVPSWKGDAEYYARALEWLMNESEKLPARQRIRVVSVSAAPSGQGSPFKHGEVWDRAVKRAEAAGMLVLDCTEDHGFIGPCWYDASAPEDAAQCRPGFPEWPGPGPTDRLLVPASPRTVAEQYLKRDTYMYCGRGGLSWSIPYCAGVMALGWQVNPSLTPEQTRQLLFETAFTAADGSRIIDPPAFLKGVQKGKPGA